MLMELHVMTRGRPPAPNGLQTTCHFLKNTKCHIQNLKRKTKIDYTNLNYQVFKNLNKK